MFYKITIVAAFDDLPPMDWLIPIRQYFLNHAQTINPGQENREISFYTLEKCYHDLEPTIPCEILQHETS